MKCRIVLEPTSYKRWPWKWSVKAWGEFNGEEGYYDPWLVGLGSGLLSTELDEHEGRGRSRFDAELRARQFAALVQTRAVVPDRTEVIEVDA